MLLRQNSYIREVFKLKSSILRLKKYLSLCCIYSNSTFKSSIQKKKIINKYPCLYSEFKIYSFQFFILSDKNRFYFSTLTFIICRIGYFFSKLNDSVPIALNKTLEMMSGSCALNTIYKHIFNINNQQ